MRGTEVTEAQIQSAREFIAARQSRDSLNYPVLDDATVLPVKFGDFARMLAWYGALRYTAGSTGVGGTLEEPGPMDVKK